MKGLLAALTAFLSWTPPALGLSSTTTSTNVQDLAFEAGGAKLEPQDLPEFLHPYHRRSLELADSLAFAHGSPVSCERAVRYGPLDRQRLDVWTSRGSGGAADREGDGAPVVIMIHGGGWDWGYREWVGFCAPSICRDDRAVLIAPSYALGRGRSQAWPQSRDDVVEVLRWTVRHAGEHGGDPSRVVLAGHSAGGHLAACVGLDPRLLERPVDGGTPVDPSIVKALFLISCPLGIRPEDFFPPRRPRWLWNVTLGPVTRFLYRRAFLKNLRPVVGERGGGKKSRQQTEEFARDASPLHWLTDRASSQQKQPFVHYSYASKKDFPICKPHGEALTRILGADSVELLEMEGVEGHFDTHFALANPESPWHDALTKTLSSI